MEKRNFKYGLKLEGRFAGNFEVLTRDEVERLKEIFFYLRDSAIDDELYDCAQFYDKVSKLFVLND